MFEIEKDRLTLEEWLDQTVKMRADLYAYGKESLPLDHGQRHLDFDKAIQNADDAGRLVADADLYLTQEIARETLNIKKTMPGATADERKMLVKGEVAELQHLRDSLAVTQRTIRDRIYTNQNENRAR